MNTRAHVQPGVIRNAIKMLNYDGDDVVIKSLIEENKL